MRTARIRVCAAVVGLAASWPGIGWAGPAPTAGPVPPADRAAVPPVNLTDYDDYRQAPIRNADLLGLIGQAEAIAFFQFDLKATATAPEGVSTWKAKLDTNAQGKYQEFFKGRCPNEITLKGDPRLFENPPGAYVSDKGFVPRNQFLLFLANAGEDGVYQCLPSNPGGFRCYRGRESYDSRTLLVGRVNGRLVVEGCHSKYGRMTGPTTMTDLLRGLRTGLSLTAKAGDGAAVELSLENVSNAAAEAPRQLVLRAPFLWAEREDVVGDGVLLSGEDYLVVRAASPYDDPATLQPGQAVVARVELPTGPLPTDAHLDLALDNHRKSLLGSLGPGEHMVRVLCHVAEEALVLSNPVTVRGAAGAAGPDELAKLAGFQTSTTQPQPPAGRPQGRAEKLATESLKGEIWFESNRAGRWDIFVMNADGTDARNVTNTADTDEFYATPSPDGRQVVYVVGELKRWSVWERFATAGRQVWLADRDGKNPRKLADNATRPTWSPDGKAVAYNCEGPNKTVGLAVQDLASGRTIDPLKKVEKWFRAGGGGAFCPTAKRLLVGGKLWTSTGGALMVVDLDDRYEFKSFKSLAAGYHGCNPMWSSDGRRVLFAHHDPAYNGAILLWSIRPDATDPRRFETPTRKSWDGYSIYCESPDGTMFTYSNSDIHVMRYADGADAQLTARQGQNMAPWWGRGVEGKR